MRYDDHISFTKDDFLSSTDPYEYVAQFIDDPFLFQQQKEKVNDIAQSEGIKTFKTLLKNYINSSHRTSAEYNYTEFTDQPIRLCSGEYICYDEGVFLDINDQMRTVCSHPILIVEEYTNIIDQTVKAKIAFRIKSNWNYIIINQSDLATPAKLISLADFGIAVTADNARLLMRYFAELHRLNPDQIAQKVSASQLGWQGDIFLPYSTDIVFDSTIEHKALYDCIKISGDYEKWKNMVLQIRNTQNVIPRVIMAASFASALIEIFDYYPFLIHVWGETGTGKTVCLKLAASIWGSSKYVQSFDSTDVGFEQRAAYLNSICMCIDELQILNKKRKVDNLIYKLCEGKSRIRGKKSGGLQPFNQWHNTIITTGEFPIIDERTPGGARNRIIEIECSNALFSDFAMLLDVIQNNYGGAGFVFTKIIQSRKDELLSIQQDYFRRILEKTSTTEKQAMGASLILLADHLTEEMMFKDSKKLTVEDMVPYLLSLSSVDIGRSCYEYILDYIVINENKFLFSGDDSVRYDFVGIIDKKKIYFVKTKFEEILENKGYNTRAFLGWAKKMNLLVTDKGRNTKTKRFKGQDPARYICIKIVYEDDW